VFVYKIKSILNIIIFCLVKKLFTFFIFSENISNLIDKPLILYLPDGLDKDLKNIYTDDYSETIEKLKNGTIYLYELFLDLNDVINKILYYKINFSITFILKL
jgi:hypothetical protein